jgi:MFS family permease
MDGTASDEDRSMSPEPGAQGTPKAAVSRAERIALVAAAAALSAWALDSAGATVAVPEIQSSLGLTITASQWILNLPMLALAGLVTLGGWLGDRSGRVRMFRIGFGVFIASAAAALIAGLAASTGVLFAARFVEGVGAAIFIPASTALLIDTYPPEARGGANGRVFAISMAVTTVGPLLAGLLVQGVGWPWAFLPGMVLAVVGLVALGRIDVPLPDRTGAPRVDWVGAVLLFLTVATLIDGLMQAGADGLTAPSVVGAIVFGLLVAAAWVAWELRSKAPLLDPRVVANRAVLLAIIVVLMRFLPSVLGGAFLARYVQQVLDFSPTLTGVAMMPSTIATFLVAGVAGKMLDRAGIRPPIVIGMGALVLACGAYAIGYANEAYLALAVGLVLNGIGLAYSNNVQPYSISSVEPARRGAIAGILPLAGQFGNAMWLAVLTAALVALGGSGDAASVQITALPIIGWAAVVAMLVATGVALMLTRAPAPRASAAEAKA